MSQSIAITPAGKLKLLHSDAENTLADSLAQKLEAAFAESSAAGLVLLAGQHDAHGLPSDCAFWRGFAWQFFQAVRQLGEAGFGQWASISPPREDDLTRLTVAAPPMVGLLLLIHKPLPPASGPFCRLKVMVPAPETPVTV